MRLFVSVEPSPAALESLAHAIEPLRPLLTGARWMAPERWHLTLTFLGEVPEARVPKVEAELAQVAQDAAPLRLALAGGGVFPSRSRPQVLWTGFTGQTEDLARLARAVARGVRRAGVAVERRPFRPHLTLARFRGPVEVEPALQALAGYVGPDYDVAEFHLMRSYLGPHPRHERLRSWQLPG